MRGLLTLMYAVASLLSALGQGHQPVFLNDGDTTPANGPLLKDGTVSFAVYAYVPEQQTRGFRAAFKSVDKLEIQLLIPDEEPEKSLDQKRLPIATVRLPSEQNITIKPNERTYFFEPYSRRCATGGAAQPSLFGY